MSIKITCVDKDNGDHYDPHEAIENFGWINENTGESGNYDMKEMIDFLEGNGVAYVLGAYQNKAYLVVQQRNGKKYVKTVADGRLTNNLLELDECTI